MTRYLLILVLTGLLTISAYAQTTEFTYQGDLQNGGSPATGSFDFEFLLFSEVTGGTQAGPMLTRSGVTVTNGIFSVKLDFGANFPGANRYLEIRVKQTGGGAFTPLAPRQAVTSAPYSVTSLNAANATNAVNATTAGNVTGVVSVANGGTGSVTKNFVDLSTLQAGIGGDKFFTNTVGANIVNATSHFTIGGNRVLGALFDGTFYVGLDAGQNNTGSFNTFVGTRAGQTNTAGHSNSFFGGQSGTSNSTGSDNSFFGLQSGRTNATGSSNAFFGRLSGTSNTTGGANSFFGDSSGAFHTTGQYNSFLGYASGYSNTTGNENTLIGYVADVGTGNLTNAAAIGGRAFVTQSNSLVLGSIAGVNTATANTNVGIGTTAPTERLHVVGNGLFTGNLTVNGTLNANLPTGSGNYIQNLSVGIQSGSFRIDGVGNANVFNSATHYNIGGSRVFSIAGSQNVFAGKNAGAANTAGQYNSFFGESSGSSNTTGVANSFFGWFSGQANMTGDFNSFFGRASGISNTTGGSSSFFGSGSGFSNTTGAANSFFGSSSGASNGTGSSNSFLGYGSGYSNTTGNDNTLIGFEADVGISNLTNAAAIGSRAYVTQSNSLVLGSISGVHFATADTNVGIGTTTPVARLDIVTTSTNGGDNTATFRAPNIGDNISHVHFGTTGDWYIRSADPLGKVVLQDAEGSGNVGIGTANPNTKLQVAGGSVYIQNPHSLVITSPNGTCWFITVNNAGALSTISITCP